MNNTYASARQRSQSDDVDTDFSVGNIAGLEEEANDQKNEKESDTTMTNATETMESPIVNNNEVTPEQLEGTVSLKVRSEELLDLIVKTNTSVIVQEIDDHYQINAEQIRVNRQDAEKVLGRMNEGRWRMLFMNRQGEVSRFNDHEFVLGIIETEAEERKELAQLNTRILADAKLDMDETREKLNMTQAQFIEVAIREFAEKVRDELI